MSIKKTNFDQAVLPDLEDPTELILEEWPDTLDGAAESEVDDWWDRELGGELA